MNITPKIIVTDTNIITDLDCAKLLDEFVALDNVYISDMIKNDEINIQTGNIDIIQRFKVLHSSSDELLEMIELSLKNKKLSKYDVINFILARNNDGLLASGDLQLKKFAEKHGVEVIRTLKIIQLMHNNGIISSEKICSACDLLLANPKVRIPHSDIIALKEIYLLNV